MTNPRNPRPQDVTCPPRIAEFLLRLALPPGVVGESIKGDLDQEFAEYVARHSVRRACAWYLLESLRFGGRYGRLRLDARFRRGQWM